VLALIKNGTNWLELSPSQGVRSSTYNGFTYPSNLSVMPSIEARQSWGIKAAAATVATQYIAAPTLSGTLTASNDLDSAYVNAATGAVVGNTSGLITATTNLVRRSHNPKFTAIIRTGAAADITTARFFIGLTSGTPANTDTQTLNMIAFRFSTLAGDAGFVPLCADGTTTSTGAALGGVVAATTRYLLQIEVNDANGTATFRVNNGAPLVMSTNLPLASAELGACVMLITNSAAARNFKFSRFVVEMD
jgi:hypothetical protein